MTPKFKIKKQPNPLDDLDDEFFDCVSTTPKNNGRGIINKTVKNQKSNI